MSAIRKKIIDALVENALYALCEFYFDSPAEAANTLIDSVQATAAILYPDCGTGNGSMRSLRSKWLYRFSAALIERLKSRGYE